jgi:ERCC4-type nuclease
VFSQPRIVADTFERASGIPERPKLAARVEMRKLGAGDYDLGQGVVVERKALKTYI